MRVSLSTYESLGDVDPMVGRELPRRARGAGMGVCAPPDFAEPLAPVGLLPVTGGMMPALLTGRWL